MRLIFSSFFILLMAFAAFGETLNIGSPAPSFSVESREGETFDLAEMKGKVVVITFWSTRCQICVEEIPKLNAMQKAYEGREVVFLGMTNENETRLLPFLQKNPFNFNIIPGSFGVLLKYADTDKKGNLNMGYPAHFLIDQNGEIVLKAIGFDRSGRLSDEIGRLLGLAR